LKNAGFEIQFLSKTVKISAPVSAKQDLILISKKMFFDIFNLDVFVTKEWQYRKKSLFFSGL